MYKVTLVKTPSCISTINSAVHLAICMIVNTYMYIMPMHTRTFKVFLRKNSWLVRLADNYQLDVYLAGLGHQEISLTPIPASQVIKLLHVNVHIVADCRTRVLYACTGACVGHIQVRLFMARLDIHSSFIMRIATWRIVAIKQSGRTKVSRTFLLVKAFECAATAYVHVPTCNHINVEIHDGHLIFISAVVILV